MTLSLFSLCAEETPAPALDIHSLVLQYVVYAAVIVVGILALLLLKRKMRLPTHEELSRRCKLLAVSLDKLIEGAKEEQASPYDFFRALNKQIYATGKLAYLATLAADKERDTGISEAAKKLEASKAKLSPYKFKATAKGETEGLLDARTELDGAVAALERILGRDRELKAKKEKRYNG